MDIKNNHPELSDEWVFKINKNIPLKNQIIYTYDDSLLINVRKIYTNNDYFGVTWTCINTKGDIYHGFRCKDRGFSEDLVDNKEAFVDLFINKLSYTSEKILKQSNYNYIIPDFLKEYEVKFLVDSEGNYFATTAILNKTAPIRGLYGATTEEEHIDNINWYGISILNRFPSEQEVQTHIIDKNSEVLSANFITRVNTAYSQIKVYHKSEV